MRMSVMCDNIAYPTAMGYGDLSHAEVSISLSRIFETDVWDKSDIQWLVIV